METSKGQGKGVLGNAAMNLFYFTCDFLSMAAQVWMILQLAGGICQAKWIGKWRYIGQAGLIVLIAGCKVWSDSLAPYQFSSGFLVFLALILSAGIVIIYYCRFWDIFCMNIMICMGVALIDFLIQTCVYLILDRLGGQKELLLSAGAVRGCYLLAGGGLAVPAGMALRRWMGQKGQEFSSQGFRYCRKLILLMIPMAVCVVYFQRVYLNVVTQELLSRWWNFIAGAGIAVMAFLAYHIWQKRKEEGRFYQMKGEMLEARYQELLREQEEKAILVHDMRNHMLAIRRMAEAGRLEEIVDYTEQIVKAFRQGQNRNWTNHELLNLILNMKFQEAERAQVKVWCECDDMSGLLLTELELCAIFSNLLDNAIEANERCPEGVERKMDVVCRRHRELLEVTVANRFRKEETREKKLHGTIKADKKGHGFGMRSIRNVIDRYGGDMNVRAEGELYTVVAYVRAFGE